ncbi:transcription factor TGA2.2 isoform X4 [Amborella trichopoda]|uniref:transcription factor TGA2.2 isoform X4 n=1 Tax=Amborella trichopoda TaxID=13333 RepID=UPI0009C08305|nr:transcription factor TGA2.2 isoform X4 [Amborella trichopoda]|eukprot:XP_020522138.1 transcription factor TGA2.2 isoform X4 [Amborella trichopoda]
MNSPSTQFAISRSMGMLDPNYQYNIWEEPFKAEHSPNSGQSMLDDADVKIDMRSENVVTHGKIALMKGSDQAAVKPSDKVLRRLHQNREAARKSRLRKKQLESSRLKLTQLEQELERARQQGVYSGHSSYLGVGGAANTGAAAFELEYANWVEEQNRQLDDLRTALQAHVTDQDLRKHVDSGMAHYDSLFRMKSFAAMTDVFYIMSGMWKSGAERSFMWIGGYRPSELLKILHPKLHPLSEQQLVDVWNLQQSSQQAEDALSQGMENLNQTLAAAMASDPIGAPNVSNYMGQMAVAMGKLEDLQNFVHQADNLRQQTLKQMHRILTNRQAARGLLALGDYLQRLRTLSSLWAARPREPA